MWITTKINSNYFSANLYLWLKMCDPSLLERVMSYGADKHKIGQIGNLGI